MGDQKLEEKAKQMFTIKFKCSNALKQSRLFSNLIRKSFYKSELSFLFDR